MPRLFSQIDTIRGLFRGNDYILFQYHKDGNLNAYFEAGTNPSNDMYWDRNVDDSNRIYGQDARTNFYNRLMANSTLPQNFYGSSAPINSSVLGRIDNSYIEITDYSGSDEINLQITPTYDFTSKTLDYSLVGSLDLENIHDFISNGINGNPVFAKIWFNPDGSINSTVPVKLSLFQGDDTTAVSGEGYFTIIFDLEVTFIVPWAVTLTSQGSFGFWVMIDFLIARGWFLKVSPGTKFATLGGCIASDVHGKNHHINGCFSEYILDIDLMLPSGSIVNLTKEDELFKATCGGMGLTGVIVSANIRLVKIMSTTIQNFKMLFKKN